jgi:hypothetical protein
MHEADFDGAAGPTAPRLGGGKPRTLGGSFGLEGSTLERVAEHAGMKRSVVRHYLGNRD